MELTFYDVFAFITIFQFLFFSFFLLSLKKGNILSNRLFSFFLFSKALCFLNYTAFQFKDTFIAISPHFFYFGESFDFLLGPALLLYAQSLAYKNFTLTKRHLLHVVPFLIHLVFMSTHFHFYSSEEKIELMMTGVLTETEYVTIVAAIYVHFLAYSIATIYLLSVYKDELKQGYSSIGHQKLTWLQLIVFAFIILWGTAGIEFAFQILGHRSVYMDNMSIVSLLIFANMIVYKGLKQPELFAGIDKTRQRSKPFLPEATRLEYLHELVAIMEDEKIYLNPTLTLNELAEKLSIRPRYLSYVINASFEKNFYDYVNAYRIEEAKCLLIKEENPKRTVLEILYASGFNSKSVFNASFKKHTGMTPLQFRKSHSQ